MLVPWPPTRPKHSEAGVRWLPQAAPAAESVLRNKTTFKQGLQIQLLSPKADQFSSDNVAWAEGDFGVTAGGG